jgi:hypothetical protein
MVTARTAPVEKVNLLLMVTTPVILACLSTISTVGYGDILPTLAVSKILTMGLMAWSIFYLVPCAVTHIVENVRVDKDKDTHEEQEWREDMLILLAEKQGLKMGVDFPEPPADN